MWLHGDIDFLCYKEQPEFSKLTPTLKSEDQLIRQCKVAYFTRCMCRC